MYVWFFILTWGGGGGVVLYVRYIFPRITDPVQVFFVFGVMAGSDRCM